MGLCPDCARVDLPTNAWPIASRATTATGPPAAVVAVNAIDWPATRPPDHHSAAPAAAALIGPPLGRRSTDWTATRPRAAKAAVIALLHRGGPCADAVTAVDAPCAGAVTVTAVAHAPVPWTPNLNGGQRILSEARRRCLAKGRNGPATEPGASTAACACAAWQAVAGLHYMDSVERSHGGGGAGGMVTLRQLALTRPAGAQPF